MLHTASIRAQVFEEKVPAGQIEAHRPGGGLPTIEKPATGKSPFRGPLRAFSPNDTVDRYQVLKHSALVLALIAATITVATILAYWSGVPAL